MMMIAQRPRMSAVLLALTMCQATRASDSPSLRPGVVPQPRSVVYSGGNVTLAPQFAFAATGEQSAILSAAFVRYGKLLDRGGASFETTGIVVRECKVVVALPSLSLDLETDESYMLELGATKCSIEAQTVFGALHAMESLVQLVQRPYFTAPAVRIEDKPRFAFRATMIDTSRHYYPLKNILQHLDSMAGKSE